MRQKFCFCVLAFSAVSLAAFPVAIQAQPASGSAAIALPVAAVKPVVDDYFGTKVSDPYRYMEALKDPDVQAWFKGQNDYARTTLAALPGRAKLLARIQELDQSVPEVGADRLPGDMYVVYKRLPNEDVGKLYVRHGLDGPDQLLADPAKIKLAAENQAKGKSGVAGFAISDDGRFMALGIVPGGSEGNSEIHVIEMATGHETGDVIAHHVGAEAWYPYWLPDGHAFVYGRTQDLTANAPVAEERQNFRVYLHVMGTDSAKDVPVFGAGVVAGIAVDSSIIAFIQIPRGSKYALGVLNGSVTPNSAYYLAPVDSIGKPNPPWRKVADFADGVTDIDIHGDDLYVLTYKNASRYKVIRLDARNPDLATAQTVVAPSEALIESISPAEDGLYVRSMDGGVDKLQRIPFAADAKPEPVALPFDGSAYVGTDPRISGALLYVTSWTKAFKIYAYDPKTKQVTDTKLQPTGPYDDPGNLESEEVRVRSHDGVMVPLSIVHKKGLKLDGSNPTLIEGYGGYAISINPYFSPESIAWFELGGVSATCHVRGGGEYGEDWHLAGKLKNKPNTWLDFIACAQYLIDNKYTSTPKLAGTGTSAGGILIGRAITARPDIFGAAIIQVGVLNPVRFELTSNGETNIPELGSVKTKDGFKILLEMDSYLHVKDGTRYPAVLLTTGMNDPRVDPWAPAKMTARLQAATSSGKPVLLRVDYGGGHGGGSGENEAQQKQADEWSFLLWQFGVPGFQPAK